MLLFYPFRQVIPAKLPQILQKESEADGAEIKIPHRGAHMVKAISLWLIVGTFSCTEKKTASSGRLEPASATVENLSLSGSLTISDELASADVGAGELSDRLVQIVDESGEVIAEGKTADNGNFTLAIGTESSLKLTGSGQVSQIVKIQSLFQVSGGQQDAVGLKQQLILDPQSAVPGASGAHELDIGSHTVKKVGAIAGQLTLETNESPVGIDVYIPGTGPVVKTDAEGKFLLGFLPQGSFTVRSERDGFNSLQWDGVLVQQKETTHLEPTVMQIAKGPKIVAFALTALSEQTGVAVFEVQTLRAAKYRVSMLQDFSDAEFRPIDTKQEAFDLKLTIPVGVRVLNIYLEAADNDGLSANTSLVIDREAPLLGKLSISGNATVVNSLNVPLIPSVQNATQMRFAETQEGLATAQYDVFASSHNFALQSGTDGVRTIYAEYADDAGNTTGSGGEISVSFILDTTAPDHERLTLLTPASPTGAFNTPLAWQSTYDEAVSYEIEVHEESDYSAGAIRTMTTEETLINVTPSLEDLDKYYWRVRAIDAAENASEWVFSGESKSFELRILAESYQARKEVFGETGSDGFLGQNMLLLPDLNNDQVQEVALSLMSTELDDCPRCGAVRIVNGATGTTMSTLSEGLKDFEQYGRALALCDLNNDGDDELIVSAPNKAIKIGDYNYLNVGGYYVYDLQTQALIASSQVDLGSTNPVPGYQCTYEYNPQFPNQNNHRCGDMQPPEPLDGMVVGAGGGWNMNPVRLFASAISCVRKTGADHLLVADARYAENYVEVGRVLEVGLSGATLATVEIIANPTAMGGMTRFGYAIAHMNQFFYDEGTATCNGNGANAPEPTIAVSAPEESSGGGGRGKVYLFQYNSGNSEWEDCAEITLENSTGETRWGSFLHNIGDIDADADGVEELAIASSGGYGGGAAGMSTSQVRIYGGQSGVLLKSLKTSTEDYLGLGYHVSNAGDFDDDDPLYNPHIAITAPRARVNGQWAAGRVLIYKWADLDNDDNDGDGDADGDPVLNLVGNPSGGSYLGARFYSLVADNDYTLKPEAMFMTSPGKRKSAQAACVPGQANCANPPPGGQAGQMTFAPGSFQRFEYLKLAPDLPYRISGTSTNAKMGSSLVGLPDIDGDSSLDFLIGQAGARCSGRPFGALSLYSTLDGVISRSLCGNISDDHLGFPMIALPKSKFVISANLRSVAAPELVILSHQDLIQRDDLLQLRELENPARTFFGPALNNDYISGEKPVFSNAIIRGEDDIFAVANPEFGASKEGMIRLFAFPAIGFPNHASFPAPSLEIGVNNLSIPFGVGTASCLGSGVSLFARPDITNAMWTEVVVAAGASCLENTDSLGAVTIFRQPETMRDYVILAEDLLGADDSALDGFGSFVQILGDYGTYDNGAAADFAADMYLLVANTNLNHGYSSEVPEFFIIALDTPADPMNFDTTTTKKIVMHEQGAAGSMLGGYAKLLPDINGDGAADFAVSHPGGTGQLGATGQVRIYSGKGMTTEDEADDLLQVLYNPEASSNNFGRSIEYADMTGDGVADFVVGADQFDNGVYQDAGAVYVFKMSPVQ